MASSNSSEQIILQPATFESESLIYDYTCLLEDEMLNQSRFNQIFRESISSPDWAIFLIQYRGISIGFCSLHFKNSLHHASRIAELEEFFIVSKARGKGYGQQTIELLKKQCTQRYIYQMEVSTNKKRQKAHSFYVATGFKDSHHKLVMELN
ncbi:GNAT family N-acetyltransferase [Jiulongibacter sediminis]|jgi:PhnO protein|uniref:GNAT family N-acetyltransferase n=1 Tax=Jiulongibacter sediminis TaxID=1605367 RepID=UPI0026EE168B|nr:GNAT family N-acetyltransferase [Jiulongibacter sediminis]